MQDDNMTSSGYNIPTEKYTGTITWASDQGVTKSMLNIAGTVNASISDGQTVYANPAAGVSTVASITPREVKGGVFAPADTKLIRESLVFYLNNKYGITEAEEKQIANLVHRLDSRI